MARRERGDGTIKQRTDGRFEARIDIGAGPDGKRRRKSIYGATRADVARELRTLGVKADAGLITTTGTPTIGAFLDSWIDTHRDDWTANTIASYEQAIRIHLKPAFGTTRVDKCTPLAIQNWLTTQKRERGARRAIVMAHAVLRSALADAAKLQLVTINAAHLVTVPKSTKRAARILTAEQAATFLAVVADHRLAALFTVALACGLRQGEALGLKWDDVDLATGEIRIRQQLQIVNKRLVLVPLKTAASRRTITVPAVCLSALRAYHAAQRKQRFAAGSAWVDTGLVFTVGRPERLGAKVGSALRPRNVRRTLAILIARADVPYLSFHELRHSAASLLLGQGVQLGEVSLLLGHSGLHVTRDIYAHLTKQTSARAAGVMDQLFGTGGKPRT